MKEVRTKKMRQVFNDIKEHLESNPLLKNHNNEYRKLDQDINRYYFGKKTGPKLCYDIKKIGDLRIYFCVEIDWFLYYCVLFTDDSWCGASKEQKINLKDAFDNNVWKSRIDNHAWKNWYVWGRYLPNSKKELNFKECKCLYSSLYDDEKYKQIIEAIYKELDDNLESIVNTGFPKDHSNIVTWE